MLEIKKPLIQKNGNKTRLCFDLILNENQCENIWYEVDSEYEPFLCDDRIDGIVVNILLYCMEHELDIVSECPISERLYYQLTNYLIPSISNNIKKYHFIKIKAPLCSTPFSSAKAVGTGLSGGIDSFYSIAKHISCDTPSFKLTHLTFFNAGASGNYGGDVARQLYSDRIAYVENFAKEQNLKLVTVDTNINEFLHQLHSHTHTFRALAIPLILQKLFSVYYYSSGCSFSGFRFYYEPAYYDLLNLPCLSLDNITFYSCGGETTGRLEKVKAVSEYEPSYKYLNVCVSESSNCGHCEKCIRTLLELYVLGKLELYSDVFDTEYFYKNLKKHYAFMLSRRKNAAYKELIAEFKKRKMKIPLSSYISAFFIRADRKIKDNKLVRRIFKKPPLNT